MRWNLVNCRRVNISVLPCLLVIIICCNRPPERFSFGRPATQREIDSVNISITPDGKGLPPGVGHVAEGKALFIAKCAPCHGPTGTEVPQYRLVATPNDTTHAKAIGNYWPYATTLYDYIRRAMPFNAPGSLSNVEVYHLTAFLLYSNQLIDSNRVISARTLPNIVMPARKWYVNDDRHGGNEVR
ncbi:cytochrome c [Chitinophaga jiangningensis]|uniref:Cytochrome c n=1 Tax=Chitinophaga jiangningensis TaxID=1419482 RepID=A0A1M7ILC5_9BACT|nr:cytochrome c [Chitinophaga jiangningensis]SHM41511.1 cytochrome c [Chitinophaga jiangningensis]